MTIILHITERQRWEAARSLGEYRADSLRTEGFIHCSTLEQVERVANRLYRGQTGLVLLCIQSERLQSTIKWKLPTPANDPHSGELFPHIYGAINLEAVVKVVDFPLNVEGNFTRPAI